MRVAPMEDCDQRKKEEGEEGVTSDVIVKGDKPKCVIWDKANLFIVDSASMVHIKEGRGFGSRNLKLCCFRGLVQLEKSIADEDV